MDLEDLAAKRADLREMHDRLAALPWARVAADEAARIMAAMDRLDSLIRNSHELRDAWKAIEWWDSCDYSEATAREAMREYEVSGGRVRGDADGRSAMEREP